MLLSVRPSHGLGIACPYLEDAEARILEEAVESSYRKGGINACIGEQEVSKETVMNNIQQRRCWLRKDATETGLENWQICRYTVFLIHR